MQLVSEGGEQVHSFFYKRTSLSKERASRVERKSEFFLSSLSLSLVFILNSSVDKRKGTRAVFL